jgi:O-antigen/teichoic acid export membrane protein
MRSFYHKFFKDTGLITLANLSVMLNGLILLPVITKILGPASYGIWIQTLAMLSLIGGISGSGSLAFVRYFASETDKTKLSRGFFTILIYLFILNSAITLGLATFSGYISQIFGNSTLIVLMIALTLPFYTINSFMFMFFRTVRKIKTYSIIFLFQNYFQLVLMVILVYLGLGISGVILGLFLSYLITEIIMLIIIIQYAGLNKPQKTDFNQIKNYLKFDIPYIPYNISGWVNNLSDRFIISGILGITAVGVYSASYSLGSLISSLIFPINVILIPALSELYDNNQFNEVKSLLETSLKYYLLLAIPAAAGISVLAKPVMVILSTEEIAMASVYIVPIVAISMVIFGSQSILNQPNNLVKDTKIVGISSLIGAILNVSLNILLIPLWGIIAAAITTLLSYTIITILTWYVSFKHLKFGLNPVFVLKSITASIIMALIIFYINPQDILGIILSVGTGALVYFILVILFKGLSVDELKEFKKFLVSIF